MTKATAALAYARLGWSLFPLHNVDADGQCSCGRPHTGSPRNRGKHPRTRQGFKDATSDLDTIRTWWIRWPSANIGVATGAEASGIVVLDVDVDGKPGEASLATLESEYGAVPATKRSRTGSGGKHIFFLATGAMGGRNGFRPGLDIKADGGYIILPPSDHFSGGVYEWISGKDIPLAPDEWLRTAGARAAAPKVPPPSDLPPTLGEIPLHRRIERASRYLVRCESAVSGQDGHKRTMGVCVRMVRGFALPPETAYSLLLSEYNPRCDPPWSERDLRRKVQQAQDAGEMEWGKLLLKERPGPAVRRAVQSEPVRKALNAPGGARWLGRRAEEVGIGADELAKGVPDDMVDDVKAGGEESRAGSNPGRPACIDGAESKQITARLKGGGGGGGGESGKVARILGIVRRADVGNVEFDLTLESEGVELTLRHLTAAVLGSYAKVWTVALEHLVALPRNAKSQGAWLDALRVALPQAEDATPDEEETTAGAIRSEIRHRLRTSPIAENYQDILRGRVWYNEERGECSVHPKRFMDAVRASLADDKPTRGLVMDVAKEMGVHDYRPRLPDQRRARLWAFPQQRTATAPNDDDNGKPAYQVIEGGKDEQWG